MALTRTRHKMPDNIRHALNERKLMDAYRERPDYQQNDYWLALRYPRQTRGDKAKAPGTHPLAPYAP
jgi:hypothetical protein